MFPTVASYPARCGAEWCCRACARLRWWRAGSGVPLVVSSQKTSDGLQERPRACDTSRYLSRNGLRHKQVLVQKWPYACTKTGASTGLALFDKQDQVVVGSHGQRASSCRTRGGRAQPGMPGCSSLMSAVPKTSERKGKGSKIGAGAFQLSVQGALFDTRVYARLRLRCQVVLALVPPVCSKDGTCMHTRSLRAAGDRGVLVSQALPPLRLAQGKAKQKRTHRTRSESGRPKNREIAPEGDAPGHQSTAARLACTQCASRSA